MAPVVVQSVTGTASNTTGVLTLTLPGPTTAGNTLAVFCGCSSPTASPDATSATLGGAAGNFASVPGASGPNAGTSLATWLDPDCAGGQTAIAVSSYTGSGTYYSAGAAYEISGLTGSPADVAALSTGDIDSFSNAWSVTGSATAQASEIWLACVAGFQGIAAFTITGPGSPWTDSAQVTEGTDQVALMAGRRVVSSTGTPGFSGTMNPYAANPAWLAVVLTLKASSGETGTGSVSLPARTLAGTGGAGAAGTGSVRLPARRIAGTGAEVVTGTGSVRLPAMSLSGGSFTDFTGTGSVTMPARTVSGTGAEIVTGGGGARLPPMTLAGSGVVDGTVFMPPMTLSGTGWASASGTGGVTLPARSLAGEGTDLSFAAGSVTLPALVLNGAGAVIFTGTGSESLPRMALAGSGLVILAGSGGVILPARSLSGTGAEIVTGTGSVMLPGMTMSGALAAPATGSGGVALPAMTLSGAGILPVREVWRTPDRVHRSGAVMA